MSVANPISIAVHLETIPVAPEELSVEANHSLAPIKFTCNVSNGTLRESSYEINTAAHAGFFETN